MSTSSTRTATTTEQPPDGVGVWDGGYFVYGVVPAGTEVSSDLLGVDDQHPQLIEHQTVAAVVGPIELDREVVRRSDLIGYGRVLDALAARGPVVPVRFGSIVEDHPSVISDVLEPRQADFEHLLRELTGCAQYNVRAIYDEESVLSEVVAADPRIRELRDRTRDLPEEASYADRVRLGELVAGAVQDRAEQDARVLMETLEPLAAAHSTRSPTANHQVLDVALLIDDQQRQVFEQRLEELAEAVHEWMTLRLVGPMAPYDFVGSD